MKFLVLWQVQIIIITDINRDYWLSRSYFVHTIRISWFGTLLFKLLELPLASHMARKSWWPTPYTDNVNWLVNTNSALAELLFERWDLLLRQARVKLLTHGLRTQWTLRLDFRCRLFTWIAWIRIIARDEGKGRLWRRSHLVTIVGGILSSWHSRLSQTESWVIDQTRFDWHLYLSFYNPFFTRLDARVCWPSSRRRKKPCYQVSGTSSGGKFLLITKILSQRSSRRLVCANFSHVSVWITRFSLLHHALYESTFLYVGASWWRHRYETHTLWLFSSLLNHKTVQWLLLAFITLLMVLGLLLREKFPALKWAVLLGSFLQVNHFRWFQISFNLKLF